MDRREFIKTTGTVIAGATLARFSIYCVLGVASNSVQRRSRVAANGRPLRRAGDLAEARERFAEHRSGLFADRPRLGAH